MHPELWKRREQFVFTGNNPDTDLGLQMTLSRIIKQMLIN